MKSKSKATTKKRAGKAERKASASLNKSNLREKYLKEVIPQMLKEFNYKSPMAVPRLEKIVVNVGIGPWLENKEAKEQIRNDLAMITGQRPVYTLARQAISGFKVRAGQRVGMVVTLRGKRMYDFLERLIVEALPRVRDFRGIAERNFGKRGNVSLGIKEQVIFAEIDSEKTEHIFGLQVSIINTARSRKEGLELLRLFGFPIRSGEETGVAEQIKSKREEAKEREEKEKKGKKKK